MKLEFNIEKDEELRTYMRDLIQGQVRSIIREDLKDMIQKSIFEIIDGKITSDTINKFVESGIKSCINDGLRQLDNRGRTMYPGDVIRQMARKEIILIINKTIGDQKIQDIL